MVCHDEVMVSEPPFVPPLHCAKAVCWSIRKISPGKTRFRKMFFIWMNKVGEELVEVIIQIEDFGLFLCGFRKHPSLFQAEHHT